MRATLPAPRDVWRDSFSEGCVWSNAIMVITICYCDHKKKGILILKEIIFCTFAVNNPMYMI